MGNIHSPRKTYCEPVEEVQVERKQNHQSRYRVLAISNFMYCAQTYEMKWIFLQNMYSLMDISYFEEIFVYYLSLEYLSDHFDRLASQYPSIYNEKYQEVNMTKENFVNMLDEIQKEELRSVMNKIQTIIIDKTLSFISSNMKDIHKEFLNNYEKYINTTVIEKRLVKNTSYSSLIEMICWYRISSFF